MIKSDILNRFQKKFNHHINRGLSFYSIEYLKKHINFDFEVFLPTKKKFLQRDLCWTPIQKQSLIFTILRDHNIGDIIVIQQRYKNEKNSDNLKFEVIDGKQRLTTIFSFIDGEFPIEIDGKNYYFLDLPEDCQKQILLYDLKWTVHYSYWDNLISDDTKIEIFEECNFLGTPQDIEHLNNLKE